MKRRSANQLPHSGTPTGASYGLIKLGHLTASSAVCGSCVNRVSLCDCHNGSPRLIGLSGPSTRTIALNRLQAGATPARTASWSCYRRAQHARLISTKSRLPHLSAQDADTPATEMLPHIVIRGIGILTRRCERTPSCISPGESGPGNVFPEPLRHCPSHGLALGQAGHQMDMNCGHARCANWRWTLPGALPPWRTAESGAEPGRLHPARRRQEHDHPPLIPPSWVTPGIFITQIPRLASHL